MEFFSKLCFLKTEFVFILAKLTKESANYTKKGRASRHILFLTYSKLNLP